MMPSWALPEHIEDVLPAEAQRIESTRRVVLDLLASYGYELVIPPLVEYVESLLTGTGRDLDLRTFKLVDQPTGRMLGLRADITPQVARIDAHLLDRRAVTRLCYAGHVVHTRASALARNREAIQLGAELYGHGGIESDMEVAQLMLRALRIAGVRPIHVDLGHAGVLRSMLSVARLEPAREEPLFRALQAKDMPVLRALVRPLARRWRDAFALLAELYGGQDVLRTAKRRLPRLPGLAPALRTLERLAGALASQGAQVHIDLAELRGYRYHSGVVYAAYAKGRTSPLARGGRYDDIGRAFGRARPATGFSVDLRELVAASPASRARGRILAPRARDPSLQRFVERLRARGEIVVAELPWRAATRAGLDCERVLVHDGRQWRVRAGGAGAGRPGANRRAFTARAD